MKTLPYLVNKWEFNPEGWMPPGKRQNVFKILSEAIVD